MVKAGVGENWNEGDVYPLEAAKGEPAGVNESSMSS
jgi:hypothetical protein